MAEKQSSANGELVDARGIHTCPSQRNTSGVGNAIHMPACLSMRALRVPPAAYSMNRQNCGLQNQDA